jgi:hypothetical protein
MFIDASKKEGAARTLLYVPAKPGEPLSIKTPFGPVTHIHLSRSRIQGSSNTGGIWIGLPQSYDFGYQGVHIEKGDGGEALMRLDCFGLCERCPEGKVKAGIRAGGFNARYDLRRSFEYSSLAEFKAKMESGGEQVELPDWPAGDYWAAGGLTLTAPNASKQTEFEFMPISFRID